MATQAGRRRLDSSVKAEYDVPTRVPRIASPGLARVMMMGVFALWVIGTLGAGTAVVDVDLAPAWLARPSAALLTVVFTIALVHRAGGHMRLWVPATALLAVAALTTQANALLAAAAVVAAVTAAVWAAVVTRPAASLVGVVREYLLAMVVALSGTVAVAAWNASVNYQRFNLIVVAAALTLALALVWNLGAGLHGFTRQNIGVIVGGAVLVLAVLAYSSFVRTHGSQALIDGLDNLVIMIRETFGGVPRPVEVVFGFPALVVGISMRSRRREGWWFLVFAVLGTSVLATSLVSPGAFPTYIGISAAYSIVLGLLVGLVVRHYVVREGSSRAARLVEPLTRVEPGRFAPLK